MRPDSELQVFTFRSDKWIGLIMQSDIGKSDGIKSDLKIPWPKPDLDLKPDDSVRRILQIEMTSGFLSSKSVTKLLRRDWHSSSARFTRRCTGNDRCVGLRIQPRCANAVPLVTHTISSSWWTRARN